MTVHACGTLVSVTAYICDVSITGSCENRGINKERTAYGLQENILTQCERMVLRGRNAEKESPETYFFESYNMHRSITYPATILILICKRLPIAFAADSISPQLPIQLRTGIVYDRTWKPPSSRGEARYASATVDLARAVTSVSSTVVWCPRWRSNAAEFIQIYLYWAQVSNGT